MTTQKIKSGQIGEDAAIHFLTQQNYQIIEKNFRNDLGEIDIIARDGDTLCFIEVKTRNSDLFGSPLESVTVKKQKKIAQVAQSYLKLSGNSNIKARFDVIAVICKDGQCDDIEIIKNAFEAK